MRKEAAWGRFNCHGCAQLLQPGPPLAAPPKEEHHPWVPWCTAWLGDTEEISKEGAATELRTPLAKAIKSKEQPGGSRDGVENV